MTKNKKITLKKSGVIVEIYDEKGERTGYLYLGLKGNISVYQMENITCFSDASVYMHMQKEDGSFEDGECKTLHLPKI